MGNKAVFYSKMPIRAKLEYLAERQNVCDWMATQSQFSGMAGFLRQEITILQTYQKELINGTCQPEEQKEEVQNGTENN